MQTNRTIGYAGGPETVDKVLATFKLGFVGLFEDFKLGFVGVLVETEQPPCGTFLVGTGVPDGPFTDGL